MPRSKSSKLIAREGAKQETPPIHDATPLEHITNIWNTVTRKLEIEAISGGDSRYSKLSQTQLYRDANPDLELDAKTRKVTEKLSESMNIIANEPSLAFFRIQEHVRKCLPQLAETKHEVQELQAKVQGASFDAEYAANAVKDMHKSSAHFQSVQDLIKNAMFMKQQLDYEQSRREQEKTRPSMYSTISSPDINLSASGGLDPPPIATRRTPQRRRHSSKHRPRVKRVMSEHIE